MSGNNNDPKKNIPRKRSPPYNHSNLPQNFWKKPRYRPYIKNVPLDGRRPFNPNYYLDFSANNWKRPNHWRDRRYQGPTSEDWNRLFYERERHRREMLMNKPPPLPPSPPREFMFHDPPTYTPPKGFIPKRGGSCDDLVIFAGPGGGPNRISSIFEQIIKMNSKMNDAEKKKKEEAAKAEDKEKEDFYNRDYDEIINKEINGIDDLIDLGKMYNPLSNKKYNINLKIMNKLLPPLTELKNMIGMEDIKQNVVDLILFYLQDFEKKNENMLHTVIQGSPGVGKTHVAKILAKIFLKMDVVKRDYFRIVKRSDLVGKYLGSTAMKTQEVIDDVKGGVLFIDEAYSLGNKEKRDHFSKECIDTLNQNLSERKCDFVCIIAGYKDELNSSFFSYNPGLARRFPFRFSLNDYSPDDLRKIYLSMIENSNWSVDGDVEKSVPIEFFKKNKDYFKFNGGDMETLFHSTKIAHARRVFCLPRDQKKKINYKDLKRGMERFLCNDEVRERLEIRGIPGMYV